MVAIACVTKTSYPGNVNTLMDNPGNEKFDATLKQEVLTDDMRHCENFIKLISLCELLQCEMKEGDLSKGMEVIDNHFSKYPELEVVHSGSAVEGLFMPLLYSFRFNTDIDHMIVRKDIKICPNMPTLQVTSEEKESRNCLLVEADHPGYVLIVNTADIANKPNLKSLSEYSLKTCDFLEESQTRFPPLLTGNMKKGILTGPSICQTSGSITSTQYGDRSQPYISRDLVYCVSLSWWPKIAEEWITRTRASGWPDSEMVASIVKSGCHVVPVGYYNSPLKEKEWRLSFSKAERFLVISLSRKQKQVYSILKCIIKESNSSHVVSSYHLKTCLLWLCENMEQKLWELNPVTLLVAKLLSLLLKFYVEQHLPNYFVKQNNMIDHVDPDTVKSAATELEHISTNLLSHMAQFVDQRMSVPVEFGSFQSCLLRKFKLDRCFKYNYFAIAIYIFFHQCCSVEVPLSSKQYISDALDLHKSKDEKISTETNPSYTEIMDLLHKCLQDDSQEGDLTEEEISSIILGVFKVITFTFMHRDFTQHSEALHCLQVLANLNETYNGGFIENYNKRRQPNQTHIDIKSKEPPEAENFKKLIMVVMIQVFIEETNKLRAFVRGKTKADGDEGDMSSLHLANLGRELLRCSKEEAFFVLKVTAFVRGIDLSRYICIVKDGVDDKQSSINILELMLERQELKLEGSLKDALQERLTKLKLRQ